jgi:hypothetical protein
VIGLYLRALGEEGGDDLSSFNVQTIQCKIEAHHGPIAADGISEGGYTCRKGEDAQKWLSNEEAKHMFTRVT